MVKRFRLIAGPNGSGKSTLVRWLGDAYKVNFYSFVNADDIFALVAKTGAYSPKFPISKDDRQTGFPVGSSPHCDTRQPRLPMP